VEENKPQIIVPRFITRKFIQLHPEWIFLYGHDLAGKGTFGQAWEAHNEPNTYPIPTCYKMCKNSMYFQDSQYEEITGYLIFAFVHLPKDKPIIPFPKIGEGYSRMKELAPKCFKYMKQELDKIKYPNIKIDYGTL